MRKKQLVAQNLSLFERIEFLTGENNAKDKRIKDLEKAVEELKKQNQKPPEVTEPLKRLEEKVMSNAVLKPDFEYGSKVIGKLVIESANGSNSLTSGGNTQHRELVNLLLGKTEVAKSEILAIVSSDADFEEKKAKIDAVRDDALDYFGSILAQIG